MIVSDIFKLYHAKSKGFESYGQGEIPFVSNGFTNNGVVGFVSPLENDRVFKFRGICVSAFCEATVQEPPFLPRGNGGSGLMVLEPITEMSKEELFYYASYINECFRWRFSFGRMVKKDRFKNLPILEAYKEGNISVTVQKLLPKKLISTILINHNRNFMNFNVSDLFNIHRGDFHAIDKLDIGKYPTVSRVALNNGIVGYFDPPKRAKVYPKYLLTVSTVGGDVFMQLEEFIATDNILICSPKKPLLLTTLFFIAMMLNLQKWRYSYGRQCYKAKFSGITVPLPIQDENDLDEPYMKSVVESTDYWPVIQKTLTL